MDRRGARRRSGGHPRRYHTCTSQRRCRTGHHRSPRVHALGGKRKLKRGEVRPIHIAVVVKITQRATVVDVHGRFAGRHAARIGSARDKHLDIGFGDVAIAIRIPWLITLVRDLVAIAVQTRTGGDVLLIRNAVAVAVDKGTFIAVDRLVEAVE